MIEVLKQSAEDVSKVYDILAFGHTERALEILAKTRTSLRQAIAELESQEPVAWLLTDKNINSLQVDSIQRLIDRVKHAHHTDLCARINGQDEWFQADWLKHMVRATPPQRIAQEPVAWMDADGNVSDNNDHKCFPTPLYTHPPQRTEENT